jgi:hypothetical protein
MRWFVEVSSIGDSSAPGRLCVEAKQWQMALEDVRQLLGDSGPLAKFSIEVIDDGYRAVNPVLRTRYVVRRAPDDAILTDRIAVRPSSIPPPGALSRSATTMPAPATVVPGLGSVTVPSDRVPPAPPPPSTKPPGARSSFPSRPELERSASPSYPAAAPAQASQLLRRRLEEPSSASPITYCEVAYIVGPGLAREDVERVLLQRFREVCSELEQRPSGKYVQLAVFDHVFERRPLRPPLATLAWKDWRGSPSIGFPAFGETAPPPSTTSMPPRVPDWASQYSTPAPPQEPPTLPPPAAPLTARPSSSIPPSSDSVRVIRSVPVGPPEVPKAAPLPEIESPEAPRPPRSRA